MPRTKRRPLRDYLIAGFLVLLLGWLSYLLVDIVRKEEIARTAAREADARSAALKDRQDTLERNLADLSTPRGREASYREQFGVARPGEEVIIVVSPDEEAPQEALPWWRKFLGYFGL